MSQRRRQASTVWYQPILKGAKGNAYRASLAGRFVAGGERAPGGIEGLAGQARQGFLQAGGRLQKPGVTAPGDLARLHLHPAHRDAEPIERLSVCSGPAEQAEVHVGLRTQGGGDVEEGHEVCTEQLADLERLRLAIRRMGQAKGSTAMTVSTQAVGATAKTEPRVARDVRTLRRVPRLHHRENPH